MELRWLPWMRSATLAEQRAEMAYIEYKQEGLWKPHLAAGIFTLCVSLMFSVVFWNNTTLHGTLFPRVYWVQHITYALSGLLELGVSLVMLFAPRFRARHAVVVHVIVSLWFVFVLGLDPYRTFRVLDSNSTYAKELEKWVVLYSPDLNSVASCSGYVLDGEQRCYYNSYEVMYSNMTLCVLAITGFYTRLPPYAFLLLVHVATALRAGLVLSLGSANTSMQVNLVELLVFYLILLILFAGVRRNDKHMRTTFFLQQRTAERLQREKERLGWDVHLITKRLEQQIISVRTSTLEENSTLEIEDSRSRSGLSSCMASLPPGPPGAPSTSAPSVPCPPPNVAAVLDEISTAVDEVARDERADLVARELVLRLGLQETLAALDAIDYGTMPPPPEPESKPSWREELEQSWLGALLQLNKEARSGTEPQNKQPIRKKRPRKGEGASSPPPSSEAMVGVVRAMPELHSPPLQPRAAPCAAVPRAASPAPKQTEKQRRAEQAELRVKAQVEQQAREQVRFEEELQKQQQAQQQAQQQQQQVKQQPQTMELLGSTVGKAVFTDEEEALRKSPES